jgi:hypothetical protein
MSLPTCSSPALIVSTAAAFASLVVVLVSVALVSVLVCVPEPEQPAAISAISAMTAITTKILTFFSATIYLLDMIADGLPPYYLC